jgi:hypothetical protein
MDAMCKKLRERSDLFLCFWAHVRRFWPGSPQIAAPRVVGRTRLKSHEVMILLFHAVHGVSSSKVKEAGADTNTCKWPNLPAWQLSTSTSDGVLGVSHHLDTPRPIFEKPL